MAIQIKLTQDPHVEGGYYGAHYRLHTDDGKASIVVLAPNWYEASAVGDDGNGYLVVWSVRDDFDFEVENDEENACDWDNPMEILNLDTGLPVQAEIIF